MSAYTFVTISPFADEPPPKGVVYQSPPGVRPVVAVQFGGLSLNLGNHNDPAGYLRTLADNIAALANEAEAALAGGAA